jgi:hypothetical protein
MLDCRLDKLIIAPGTAVRKEVALDNEATSQEYLLNAFRLSLQG